MMRTNTLKRLSSNLNLKILNNLSPSSKVFMTSQVKIKIQNSLEISKVRLLMPGIKLTIRQIRQVESHLDMLEGQHKESVKIQIIL